MNQDQPSVHARTRRMTAPNLLVVSTATGVSVLSIILVVRDLAHQPVLVTSLASSTFLLYYQPLNEINRLRPLVFGHLIGAAVGFAASRLLPVPYLSTAFSLGATVALLTLLRLVHPPAVSTSVVFSFRPHDASALATFILTLAVIAALALIYLLLHVGLRPSRWAHLFGLTERRPRDRAGAGDERQTPVAPRSSRWH